MWHAFDTPLFPTFASCLLLCHLQALECFVPHPSMPTTIRPLCCETGEEELSLIMVKKLISLDKTIAYNYISLYSYTQVLVISYFLLTYIQVLKFHGLEFPFFKHLFDNFYFLKILFI